MPNQNLKIFNSTTEAKEFLKDGSALAIGNYDGIHHGHQAILKNLIIQAKKKNLTTALLTFEPHPVKILAPDVAPKLIYTLDQKIEILAETGIDSIIFQKFDHEFAKKKPEEFFTEFLINDLSVKYITVGYDFTFGENRSGTIETMEMLAKKHKIAVDIVQAKMINNTLVSSSVIRKLINDSHFALAKEMLTRPFFIDGKVIHGHNRGTALGIHTANLDTKNELIPYDGVYATIVQLGGKSYQSATNIGYNPTFDNPERSIESHIFNFDSEIFDKNIRLIFAQKLREEIRFVSPEALVMQIEKDIEHAKKVLENFKYK